MEARGIHEHQLSPGLGEDAPHLVPGRLRNGRGDRYFLSAEPVHKTRDFPAEGLPMMATNADFIAVCKKPPVMIYSAILRLPDRCATAPGRAGIPQIPILENIMSRKYGLPFFAGDPDEPEQEQRGHLERSTRGAFRADPQDADDPDLRVRSTNFSPNGSSGSFSSWKKRAKIPSRSSSILPAATRTRASRFSICSASSSPRSTRSAWALWRARVHSFCFARRRNSRIGLPNSHYLIHQPLSGIRGWRPRSRFMPGSWRRLRVRINRLIAEETGQPLDRVEKDTDRDFWMNADEAQSTA